MPKAPKKVALVKSNPAKGRQDVQPEVLDSTQLPERDLTAPWSTTFGGRFEEKQYD